MDPRKPLHKSVGVLLIVTILHAILALMFMSVARMKSHQGIPIDKREAIARLSLPFVFYALSFWARRSPVIASAVGLVLYVTVEVLIGIAQPGQWKQGIVIKIIIVLALVRAMYAGLASNRARRADAAVAGNGSGA